MIKNTHAYQIWHFTKSNKKWQWVLDLETPSREMAHNRYYELERLGERADLRILSERASSSLSSLSKMAPAAKVPLSCRITLTTAQALKALVLSTGQPQASLVESALVDYIAMSQGGRETIYE